MAKNRILVVEDESIVSKDIQRCLKKMGYEIVGAASTGEKAIEIANEEKPDLILMDIMLKGEMSGIQAAAEIRKKKNIPIIYLTAYADDNTLNKAKIAEPYGYIIKPFKDIDLRTSIEMALYKNKKEKEIIKERDSLVALSENKELEGVIFVKSNSRMIKVKTVDILFVEALKDYVIICTQEAKYIIHSTMKDIEKKLPKGEFQRIHRSYIVRLDKITAIEQPNVVIEGAKKILPIGGSYKEELFKRINLV